MSDTDAAPPIDFTWTDDGASLQFQVVSADPSGGVCPGIPGSNKQPVSGITLPTDPLEYLFTPSVDATSCYYVEGFDGVAFTESAPVLITYDTLPRARMLPGPSGTLSYAIVLFDVSAPFTHWAVWNIPATTNALPASLPAGSNPAGITGAKQVSFNANHDAYAGPGAVGHVYQFTVYALKVATISPNSNTQDAVRSLLEGSADVLKKVSLAGASVK